MSFLDTSSLPAINPATEPAAIRNGNPAAKRAYAEGLAFEQVLVDQLSQELTKTVSDGSSSTDGSSDGASDGSTDSSSSGLMGSDAASSMYAQMLPQTLSSSIMSSGGMGLAMQIARGLDPSLGEPAAPGTSTSATSATDAAATRGAGGVAA